MRRTSQVISAWVLTLALVAGCSDGGGPLVDGLVDVLLADGGAAERRPDQRLTDATTDRCAASAALLKRVDPARMKSDLTLLVGLGERRSAVGQSKAADYLRAELGKLAGWSVRDQSYTYKGASYVNLEATLAGSDATAPFILAGAHFDSTSSDATSAPGADDDASGTVAVLEAARALAGCHPQRSIRLLFFSNEEAGTVGSTQYVASIKATLPPSKVTGFISVDMVGFGADTEDLDLATKTAQKPFADAMKSAIEPWTALKVKEDIGDQCG
jgi:Zn-dependent M28 family amino/carboxypeptidase